MANNNVQNVRFLRNGSLYGTRAEALTRIQEQQLTTDQDGSIILARYSSGNDVKTLVGLVYASNARQSLTIFDIEGAASDVQSLREEINAKLGEGITSDNTATEQLAALSGATFTAGTSNSADTSVEGAKAYAYDLVGTLDYTDTAVTGSYVSAVNEADGIISVTRVALPDASSVADDNKVVTDVTQSKGAITATASNITGIKLAGYSEGTDADIAATDTLGQALGKLQAQINAMDKDASAVDGQVVTTVSEDDGKVTETKANVKDLQLGGYAKTNDTGDIASADTINVALSKLENKAAAITITNDDGSINVTTAASGTDINVNIKSGEKVIAKDGNKGIYTNIAISAVTGTELEGLGTNVKEAYKLVATNGDRLGEFIKIYKDSALKEIYLGSSEDTINAQTGVITKHTVTDPQSLNYAYQLADGTYTLVKIDVSKFLTESEFASGVTQNGAGVVTGVVDTNSETNSGGTAFLTVGADGFKVSGIKQEIIDRINELDADLSGNTTHVKVGVAEAYGKITAVTVDETDIASQSLLNTLSGKTVTAVEMTGGTAAIAANSADGTKKITINTDGSQVLMTNYSKGSDSGAVATTDSVNTAIAKLENQIASKVDALDAAVSGETADGKVNVKVTQENGVITAVDVVGTDIASASALTAEIAARKVVDGQDGQTYVANAGKTYISGATSLNDADIKLNDALKSLSDATVNEVQVNGVALAETSNAVNVQISAAAGTGAASTPLIVNTNNSTGAVTIQLEGLDCGTY